MATKASTRAAQAVKPPKVPKSKPLRMPCCRCVKEKGKTIGINTGTGPASTQWTVSGPGVTNPIAQVITPATVNSNWTATLSPARWVQPDGSNGEVVHAAGIYNYEVEIEIPKCTVPTQVKLVGQAAGDDQIRVFVDNSTTPIASTNILIAVPGSASPGQGGWGFKAERIVPFTHTWTSTSSSAVAKVRIEVNNGGGPHGLLVRAALTTICPTKMEL